VIKRDHASAVSGGGITKDRGACHARRDLFEQFQPFPAYAVFVIMNPGGVAARSRKAVDVASTRRIR
jgi:hypothetical protein